MKDNQGSIVLIDVSCIGKPFTTHATLPKGGAALQNLRIPILPPKTINFPTFKTQFLLHSELEVDLFALLPPSPKRKFF